MLVLFVTRHLETDSKKMYTLNLSQGAHPAGAYPGFHSMKGQGVLLLPPGWMVSPSQGSSHLPEKGTDHQLKKLLIVRQILLVRSLEMFREQYAEYAYWC